MGGYELVTLAVIGIVLTITGVIAMVSIKLGFVVLLLALFAAAASL